MSTNSRLSQEDTCVITDQYISLNQSDHLARDGRWAKSGSSPVNKPSRTKMISINDKRPLKDRALSSLVNSECVWPDLEASTGEFKRMMGSKMCWTAIGPALDAFKRSNVDMGKWLHQYGESSPDTVLRTIWMIGTKKSSLRPTVVFSSSDREARKKIQKSIQSSGILQKEQFESINCNRPPDFPTLMLLVLALKCILGQEFPDSMFVDIIPLSTQVRRTFGIQLAISIFTGKIETSASATGGGVLEWNGKYFVMTAAHAFQRNGEGALFKDDYNSEFEFDFDGADFSGEDDKEIVHTTSRGSDTTEVDSHDTQSSLSGCQSSGYTGYLSARRASDSEGQALHHNSLTSSDFGATFTSSASAFSPRSNNSAPLSPMFYQSRGIKTSDSFGGAWFTSSISGPSPLLDYALIEVTGSHIGLDDRPRTDETEDDLTSKQNIVPEVKGQSGVIAWTSKGPIRGRMLAAPSFGTAANSTVSQELWTIELDGKLEQGDCGCWIVDALSGAVYGHLIAGSPGTGTGLVVPLSHVLKDLFVKFGGDWKIAPKYQADQTDNVPTHTNLISPLLEEHFQATSHQTMVEVEKNSFISIKIPSWARYWICGNCKKARMTVREYGCTACFRVIDFYARFEA